MQYFGGTSRLSPARCVHFILFKVFCSGASAFFSGRDRAWGADRPGRPSQLVSPGFFECLPRWDNLLEYFWADSAPKNCHDLQYFVARFRQPFLDGHGTCSCHHARQGSAICVCSDFCILRNHFISAKKTFAGTERASVHDAFVLFVSILPLVFKMFKNN